MASRPTSPTEPTKTHPPPVRPNAHPYAIKTTSSALLSRSTTSPLYANHMHHYVPQPSPSRVTPGIKARHRHSSSVGSVHNDVRPTPLPTPPSSAVSFQDNPLSTESRSTYRVRRAGTMPSSTTEPVTDSYHLDQGTPELHAGLSPDPKQWNTNELVTYLESSLGSSSNANARQDIEDILAYVRTRSLTGHELLRLTDGGLAGAPLSDVQRAQLLERSRTLRADALRGRLSIDSHHNHRVSDNSNDVYALSVHSATPFHSIRGASMSADDLRLPPDDEEPSAFPSSPAVTLHRSNSVLDASVQRYRDLARMRMRRRGRVKGLVETWERASASESDCSASEEGSVSGSEAETDSESDSVLNGERLPDSSSVMPSDRPDASPREAGLSTADSKGEPLPPPPYTHQVVQGKGEEPSIEELLASSLNTPLKGARAWEADFGLGETVKRVPTALPIESSTSRDSKDSGHDEARSKRSATRGNTGSRRKASKTKKRVVTAIFTGSPSTGTSEAVGDGDHVTDHHGHMNGAVCNETQTHSDLQQTSDSTLRALEASIAATRSQVDRLRVRLERIEADTARREAELKQTQYANVLHTSGFKPRQRHSEVGVQTTAEITEPDGLETMSLGDIARAVAVRAVGWLFPSGRLPARDDQGLTQACAHSRSGTNDKSPLPAKRGEELALASMSCNIILFSFAICAAVLRRMGFGRWVRGP